MAVDLLTIARLASVAIQAEAPLFRSYFRFHFENTDQSEHRSGVGGRIFLRTFEEDSYPLPCSNNNETCDAAVSTADGPQARRVASGCPANRVSSLHNPQIISSLATIFNEPRILRLPKPYIGRKLGNSEGPGQLGRSERASSATEGKDERFG